MRSRLGRGRPQKAHGEVTAIPAYLHILQDDVALRLARILRQGIADRCKFLGKRNLRSAAQRRAEQSRVRKGPRHGADQHVGLGKDLRAASYRLLLHRSLGL
eukprot:scaffold2129_cov255-Pinguiococcus_pyrenoidosus.AAC.14